MTVYNNLQDAYTDALGSGNLKGPDFSKNLSNIRNSLGGRSVVLGMHQSDPNSNSTWVGIVKVDANGEDYSILETEFSHVMDAFSFRKNLIDNLGGENANISYSDQSRQLLTDCLEKVGFVLKEHVALSQEEMLDRVMKKDSIMLHAFS